MPHTTCNRHLTQELSQQYLNGKLSPKEMYTVEDRLLENDFYFEALEGLELVPWDRCQRAVDEVSDRIIQQFNIRKRSSRSNYTVATAILATLVLGAGLTWFAMSGPEQTTDLTPESSEKIQPSANGPNLSRQGQDVLLEKPATDSLATLKDTSENNNTAAETEPVVDGNEPTLGHTRKPNTRRPQNTSSKAEAHIAVGRIVDINGSALPDIVVSAGPVKDVTDPNGYYAIRVPSGMATLQIRHREFSGAIEIDTNENWEIVLDLATGTVKDFYPINGGNRFK